MPSDVLGLLYSTPDQHLLSERACFRKYYPGVDEINRAPAKTQSALFEVKERQVTVRYHTCNGRAAWYWHKSSGT
ncbi:hypothetical protein CS542_04760 [Pedobacter sp. IW39]|nr:hypothetical protein CS542_04760 [Pedobacter sp. IW39]